MTKTEQHELKKAAKKERRRQARKRREALVKALEKTVLEDGPRILLPTYNAAVKNDMPHATQAVRDFVLNALRPHRDKVCRWIWSEVKLDFRLASLSTKQLISFFHRLALYRKAG